jgi:hypothetical protein
VKRIGIEEEELLEDPAALTLATGDINDLSLQRL